MFSRRWLFAFAFLPLCVAGCGSPQPPTIVTTTSLIADATKRIAGPHWKVECLMGPGVDPHKYQPSASDLGKLSSAKLVLFNGLHLEGKMVDVLEKPAKGRKAVAVTRSIPETDLHKSEPGSETVHDPHIWFDVRLWKKCIEVIRDELCELDPAHADEFRANAEVYLKELDDLHKEVLAKAAKLPATQRILVTSHDAFGYFAAAYGFEVHGLQGVSTASESGTQDVQTLAKLIGEKKVPALFTETSVPSKGLEKVIGTVKETYKLDVRLIAGDDALYSDALGESGSTGATYIGMVRHNIDVIVKALSP
jgi:manganese/zinc/iron transport system substrate-binding protein